MTDKKMDEVSEADIDIQFYKNIRDVADNIVKMSVQLNALENLKESGIEPIGIDIEFPDDEGHVIRFAIPIDKAQADLAIKMLGTIIRILRAKLKDLTKELKRALENE